MKISDTDLKDLRHAKQLLEGSSFAVKLGNLFGEGLTSAGRWLPDSSHQKISHAAVIALEKSWVYSLKTMSDPHQPPAPPKRHKLYATLSGAIGGVAVVTLIIELPITTIIMIRAIADIARSYGENYADLDTKIACLEVFALGGEAIDEATGETGYYAIRAALKKPLEESTKYMAQKGAAGMGAPFVVQLLAKIAVYYQTVVSAKIAAIMVPMAGAMMGAAINIVFIEHFQEKAEGHFMVRRLERKYGPDPVKQAYKALPYPITNTQILISNTQYPIPNIVT
jgi:hypothetical protein